VRFSQRIGRTEVRSAIQRESLDDVLRTKLWSALYLTVFDVHSATLERRGIDAEVLAKRLWLHFFQRPIDQTPKFQYGAFAAFARKWFVDAQWFEVYDFIEAVVATLNGRTQKSLVDMCNNFLEAEMSAYRLVDGRVAEITSETEISAIEQAIDAPNSVSAVQVHLREALAKLTSRDQPDYRNSVKESISAVEALCRAIAGDPAATLGKAIKRLREGGIKLHPSLEQAWSKLYGYTSDEGGIRHALSGESEVTFADAKYMLVSCSAFTSHLLELSRIAGIGLMAKE
jgi:uncharacterized protein with PIN domain